VPSRANHVLTELARDLHAERLTGERLGVGNRSIVMLLGEAKARAKWALVRFKRVR
jgi:hypothetical protein